MSLEHGQTRRLSCAVFDSRRTCHIINSEFHSTMAFSVPRLRPGRIFQAEALAESGVTNLVNSKKGSG